MPTPSAWTVAREILTASPDLSADEVIKRAASRGVTVPRATVHNVRSELKKTPKGAAPKPAAAKPAPAPAAKSAPVPVPAAKSAPVPVPAAKSAPVTVSAAKSTPVPVPAAKKPAVTAAKPAAVKADLAGVLANVALVDRVAGLSGGVPNAREVAEAVRACGGVDAFLQHLDLVAGIKGA